MAQDLAPRGQSDRGRMDDPRRPGSRRVVDIQGDLHTLARNPCHHDEEAEAFAHFDVPPHYPPPGEVLRPDVVPFGEELPVEKLALLRRAMGRGFDLVVSVGTGSVSPYIAEPVQRAQG